MNVFTIYRSPLDVPGKYVMREFEIKPHVGPVPLATAWVAPLTALGLEQLREIARGMGYAQIERSENDDPVVVESWI